MVGDLVRLIESLGTGPLSVVGYSMGVELGLRLTVDRPDRVRSLCMAGSGWSGDKDLALYQGPGEAMRSGEPAFLLLPYEDSDGASALALLEGQDPAALAAVALGMDEVIALPREAVAGLSCPVLGVAGEHDPERPNIEKLAEVVDDFRIEVIAGRHHMGAPSDPRFDEVVCAFLEQTTHDEPAV